MGVAISQSFGPKFIDRYLTVDYNWDKDTFGNVYGPIQWKYTQVVIKRTKFADGKVSEAFKQRIQEKKNIWTSLQHKHLVRIHSVDLTRLPEVMFFVMEFAAGGSLHKTLISLGSENKLPIYVVTDWAKQIAKGMLYLHQQDIVHKNFKSSNSKCLLPKLLTS